MSENYHQPVSEDALDSSTRISATHQIQQLAILKTKAELEKVEYDSQDSQQMDFTKSKFSLARLKKAEKLYQIKRRGICSPGQNKFSSIQDRDFSSNLMDEKQILIYPSLSTSIILEVPNPLCIGCIKFFYNHLPYNFDQSYQKPIILSPLESKSVQTLKKILYRIISKKKQCYVLVTESKNQGNKIFIQGFPQEYNYQWFISKIKQLVREITYRSGQMFVSLINFSMNLIPVLEDQFINQSNQQSHIDHYFFKNVLRLRFSPCYFDFKRKAQMRLSQICHEIGNVRKASRCHWPIQCYQPIRYQFVPYMNKKKASQLIDQKDSKYQYFTMVDLSSCCFKSLAKLEYLLNSNNIQFSICRPFQQIINKKSRRYQIYFINHQCSHKLLGEVIKDSGQEITSLNISFVTKNILIYDEQFFSNFLDGFARIYDSVTDDGYAMFNLKKGLRLQKQIKSLQIYIIFNDIRCSILACCILNDLGMRRFRMISQEKIC